MTLFTLQKAYLLLGGGNNFETTHWTVEYTLCPSSLFNTAYVQGAGRGGPRTYYVSRLTPRGSHDI
eukprot:scaffold22513_cov57-Attheya_sp.AAC.3